MSKYKQHHCKYQLRKTIIRKLSRNQVFGLCILGLVVLAVIGIYAPAALLGIL